MANIKNWIARIWWLWAAFAGFLIGGGWKIFADFKEWQYATFYHDNLEGTQLYSIFVWLLLGPLPCALGMVLVIFLARWVLSKPLKRRS